MRRKITLLAVLVLVGLLFTAAGPPLDEEVPPQPFFPDFFSGRVLVQGSAPPAGLPLVACIDECDEVYESTPVIIGEDGAFEALIVNPGDPDLLGHVITFYLFNDLGRIQAREILNYEGNFGPCGAWVGTCRTLDINFDQPVPAPQPTPTAVLPATGDPTLASFPRYFLLIGAAALALGAAMLVVVRRTTAKP